MNTEINSFCKLNSDYSSFLQTLKGVLLINHDSIQHCAVYLSKMFFLFEFRKIK